MIMIMTRIVMVMMVITLSIVINITFYENACNRLKAKTLSSVELLLCPNSTVSI